MPDVSTVRVIIPPPILVRIDVSFAQGADGPAGAPGAPGPPGSDTNVIIGHPVLRAIVTVSTTIETVMHNVFTQIGGEWVSAPWLLISGTDPDDDEFIIRPDDYAPVTNEKVWVKTGGQ